MTDTFGRQQWRLAHAATPKRLSLHRESSKHMRIWLLDAAVRRSPSTQEMCAMNLQPGDDVSANRATTYQQMPKRA